MHFVNDRLFRGFQLLQKVLVAGRAHGECTVSYIVRKNVKSDQRKKKRLLKKEKKSKINFARNCILDKPFHLAAHCRPPSLSSREEAQPEVCFVKGFFERKKKKLC